MKKGQLRGTKCLYTTNEDFVAVLLNYCDSQIDGCHGTDGLGIGIPLTLIQSKFLSRFGVGFVAMIRSLRSLR